MQQAQKDLIAIRALFEQFESKMVENLDKAIKRHGAAHTIHVMADIASIRQELLDLHQKMFPYTPPPTTPLSDEDMDSYM